MTRSRSDSNASSRQARTILLAADHKHSTLAEIAGDQTRFIAYSAYGHQSAQQAVTTALGFNGELREARLGWYLLGNGYRAYNPTLMRFHSPDSWSPFGRGGLNAYMYCVGDPVSFSDPTGHMFLSKIFGKLGSKNLGRTSSTSSVGPLITNATEIASTSQTKAISKTIPALTLTETVVTERHFIDYIDYGPFHSSPPQRPSKLTRLAPRFNDTGGEMSIGNHEVWRSEIYSLFPSGPPPLPAARTRPDGVTRYYSMRYHDDGHTTLKSIEKISLPIFANIIRNPSNVK